MSLLSLCFGFEVGTRLVFGHAASLFVAYIEFFSGWAWERLYNYILLRVARGAITIACVGIHLLVLWIVRRSQAV